MAKTPEEETWENLNKEYLTTEQKLDIIQKYNTDRNKDNLTEAVKALNDYLDQRDKDNGK